MAVSSPDPAQAQRGTSHCPSGNVLLRGVSQCLSGNLLLRGVSQCLSGNDLLRGFHTVHQVMIF